MVRRRRNKIILWDWSPDGSHKTPRRQEDRKHALGRDALRAVVLLGAIIFGLSLIPDSSEDGSYRRDRLARYMCEVVGSAPGTAQCVAVSIGGWFLIVVTLGVVLKAGREILNAVRADR